MTTGGRSEGGEDEKVIMEERSRIDDQHEEKVEIDGCLEEVGYVGSVGLSIAIYCGVHYHHKYLHHLLVKL